MKDACESQEYGYTVKCSLITSEAEGGKGVWPTNVNMYLSKVSCSKFFQQFELISRKVHGNLRVLVCNIKQNKSVVVVSHGVSKHD